MKKNRRYMLFVMLVIALPSLLIACAEEEIKWDSPPEEIKWDGPLGIKWDDTYYYWTGEEVYEDLLCPDAVGTISSVVGATDPVSENGQTNISKIKEGAEIRRTAYGDAIAVFVEGRWVWFELYAVERPEDYFYVPD